MIIEDTLGLSVTKNTIGWLNIYFGKSCHHQELQLTDKFSGRISPMMLDWHYERGVGDGTWRNIFTITVKDDGVGSRWNMFNHRVNKLKLQGNVSQK
jgi:hypothetical protein